MTWIQLHDLATRYVRVLLSMSCPLTQRAQGMPGARRARSLACKIKKHTSIVTTVTPDSPDIPRAMVLTDYHVLSPVTGLFATVASGIGVSGPTGPTSPSANLTPAPGCQDHTPSPSANRRSRQQHRSR